MKLIRPSLSTGERTWRPSHLRYGDPERPWTKRKKEGVRRIARGKNTAHFCKSLWPTGKKRVSDENTYPCSYRLSFHEFVLIHRRKKRKLTRENWPVRPRSINSSSDPQGLESSSAKVVLSAVAINTMNFTAKIAAWGFTGWFNLESFYHERHCPFIVFFFYTFQGPMPCFLRQFIPWQIL